MENGPVSMPKVDDYELRVLDAYEKGELLSIFSGEEAAAIMAAARSTLTSGSRPMKISEIRPQRDWVLVVLSEDGRVGRFDVAPQLEFEAFAALRDQNEFTRVINGGHFVKWECGAELSADTIEAGRTVVGEDRSRTTA